MPKSLDQLKSSLKLRAQSRHGALTLRLGVKKYSLPFEVRMLNSSEFIFVHIPPSAEIMKFTSEGLELVTDLKDGETAAKSFRKSKKRASTRASKLTEIPEDVASALSKVPAGYKIGYGADGSPKLVRTRKRRKK